MMTREKTDKSALASNEFSFYLDAWLYCWKNKFDLANIKRKSWDVWMVEI